MKRRYLAGVFLILTGCATTEVPTGLLGAYQLEDGRIVSIRPSVKDTLRYRVLEDGDSGRLFQETALTYVSGPGFSQRDPVELTVKFVANEDGIAQSFEWQSQDDAALKGRRIGTVRDVWFNSGNTRLYGRLYLPETPPPYNAVVLVHGSGDAPGTEFYNSDFFVASGIAAFSYDKRGSGQSEGSFTYDFQQLARDAIAATEYLKTVPEIRADNIGLSGYSQGAWVAPLAASQSDSIRFVVVNYGMIESPAEEARLEMLQLVIDGGATESELFEADELIRAAVNLVANEFESGWPEFLELKKKYRHASWVHNLDGTPVGQLMSYPKFVVKLIGKRSLPAGVPWYYESTELLETCAIPMAWLLAEDDRSSPNAQTVEKLEAFISTGKPYELIVFPDADHGMLTFEEGDDGRTYTGYATDYFRSEVEAAKRLASTPYEISGRACR